MTEVTDETLEQEIDKVVDEETQDDTENLEADDEALEDDDSSDSDDSEESDDAADDTADGDDAVADDEEDDDEDAHLDYARPEFKEVAQVEDFDITKVPRDANGNINPAEVNKAIKEHTQKVLEAQQSGAGTDEKARALLTKQWEKGKTKFPAVSKSKHLSRLARDLHINSINNDEYLSPIAAMKKVDTMYRKATKSGIKSERTRKRVAKVVKTETGGGKEANKGKMSEAERAAKMANSSNPEIARKGRQAVLRIRREARNRK